MNARVGNVQFFDNTGIASAYFEPALPAKIRLELGTAEPDEIQNVGLFLADAEKLHADLGAAIAKAKAAEVRP